jgi:hypothetical protein
MEVKSGQNKASPAPVSSRIVCLREIRAGAARPRRGWAGRNTDLET